MVVLVMMMMMAMVPGVIIVGHNFLEGAAGRHVDSVLTSK